MAFFGDDFAEFSVEMDKLEIDVKEMGNVFKQKIALQVLEGVVLTTRVDTGRARNGWQTTLHDPSEKVTTAKSRSGREAIARGTRKILAAEDGDDIWIANNVEYIKYLNYGTDRRVGDFMVERTLARVRSQTER